MILITQTKIVFVTSDIALAKELIYLVMATPATLKIIVLINEVSISINKNLLC